MNIVVCIKQVPDVDDIKWTKENNLDRSLMLSKINPCDDWALDYALKLKKTKGDIKVTVVSMGPNQAVEILNYAFAKGADRAILLSDKFFAASDTLATSKILAAAIKKYIPEFDLIITGQKALDGDTEQVPVSMAQMLNIVDVGNITEIYNADKYRALASQKILNKINMLEIEAPCLLSVKEECDEKFIPKIEDYVRAQGCRVETYCAEDLGLSKNEIGILGSPTLVYKAFRPIVEKQAVEINDDCSKTILDFLLRVE